MILRFLNWQGIAGITVAFALMVMLTVQKFEAVHWKEQSEKFGQLYQHEQAAFALYRGQLSRGCRAGRACRQGQCRARRRRAADHQRKDPE